MARNRSARSLRALTNSSAVMRMLPHMPGVGEGTAAPFTKSCAFNINRLLRSVHIDPKTLPQDGDTLRKIVVDLIEQLDRSLAEQNKYQNLLRELLEAQRNRKSEQLSKEQGARVRASRAELHESCRAEGVDSGIPCDWA
jgi:hypothetical protein